MKLRRLGIRLVVLCGVLLAVSFLTFSMIQLLPGDPALQILGADNATPENIAAVRADLGLDKPFMQQYLTWVGDALGGDLGRSFQTNQPVREAITERIPVTAEVGLLAVVMALVLAIPLGVASAYRAGGKFDRALTTVSFALLSVPGFMLALLFIWTFAVRLGWLPASGWVRLTSNPWQNLRTAILPSLSLAIAEMAVYTRLLRSDMVQTLQEDFLLFARAKGLPSMHILFRHALRPSSLSLMTVIGLQLAGLLGGAVIVESIFALPGVGRLLVDAIYQRDILVVQGVVLVLAASFVIVNFLIDLVYTIVDPRIR